MLRMVLAIIAGAAELLRTIKVGNAAVASDEASKAPSSQFKL